MKTIQKRDEAGFGHVVLVLLFVVVLGLVGFAGWLVVFKKGDLKNAVTLNRSSDSGGDNSQQVTWEYNGDAWKASGTPPACPDPLLSVSPVDLSLATAILYPGQTRNMYKPHGGFIFGNATDNDIEVKVAMEAAAVDGARYIEDGTVQYMFDLINPCGVQLRYDHLLTLTDAFQQLADTLPEPKPDESRTTKFTDAKQFKAGEVIATAVGFPAPKLNVSVDFGVYDLRTPNEASKNATYAAAQAGIKSLSYHAICWLNELPVNDATAALALPGGDAKAGKTSDYCK